MFGIAHLVPARTAQPKPPDAPIVLTGIPASAGLVFGPLYVYSMLEWPVADRFVAPSQAAAEYARLQDAVARTRHTLEDLRSKLAVDDADTSAGFIFQSHISLLDDPLFQDRARREILENHRSAEGTVSLFAKEITGAFLDLEDRFFQEKAMDVQDVMRHLLYSLSNTQLSGAPLLQLEFDEPQILVASNLTPSDTILLPRDRVLGFATEGGSRLSHVAILANAQQIPAVVGLGAFVMQVQEGDVAILDGTRGTLIIRPTPEQIATFEERKAKREAFERQFSVLVGEPAVTRDGERVSLMANLELPDEAEKCARFGGDGVGLYRTEYGYLYRDALPTEEELYEDYRAVLVHLAPMDVTFRTIDLGGDKILPFLQQQERVDGLEHLRAVRLCLRYPTIWMPQLRAIWRAACEGNARIMFPHVPGVAEFRAAKALALQARDALIREGVAVPESLPMGVMIELPSAVIVSDLLAKEADFFSIGTNDLIPYSLGVDRAYMDKTMVSEPYHPGILRSIRHVVREARKEKVPVTVCGEIAGDPFYTLPLIGAGIRELSMSPAAIPEVKRVVRHTTVCESEAVFQSLLHLPTAQAVEYELHRYMLENYAHLLVAKIVASEGA